jgi:hypothetical protein
MTFCLVYAQLGFYLNLCGLSEWDIKEHNSSLISEFWKTENEAKCSEILI